jgi:hypothetical protein
MPNQGVFQRQETCERCGKQRTKVTLPPGVYQVLTNGIYPPGAHWTYTDPDNWVVMTEDEEIAKTDIVAEFDYRMAELLYRIPKNGG